METIKKFFDDENIVIGLCQLRKTEDISKTVLRLNSIKERDYYLDKLFTTNYADNILLG